MSRTAEIRALARDDRPKALHLLTVLLTELFDLKAEQLLINDDQYSLNSLNGFFSADGADYFFKFHQEEGEEAMSGEYYRAEILAQAGLPVDQPLFMSTRAGEQILIYRRRNDPRFSDILRQLDLAPDPVLHRQALAAEHDLNEKLLAVYRDSLHPITPAQSAEEPIHRLFHERLTDARTKTFPGGRYADFYVGKEFQFPGLTLGWSELAQARWTINGIAYRETIGELFNIAAERLQPHRLADAGGVVAHGDAHNANVWFTRIGDKAELAFFDPAFAGRHVPSLLAEIKSTFHNIFAHPLWLYEPALASKRYHVQIERRGDDLMVETDWQLSAIRNEVLEIKAAKLWRPLLAELTRRRLLPPDWRQVMQLALFLCPTLVMNLRAGAKSHDAISSLIAFSAAVMVGNTAINGETVVSRFLDQIEPRAVA